MRKLLIFVGVLLCVPLVSAVPSTINTAYCMEITANDTYVIVTQDINFTNTSSYNYQCFRREGTNWLNNITIDFNGFTLYANDTHPNLIWGVRGFFGSNWTVQNGIINFTDHATTGYGIGFTSTDFFDIIVENMTVVGDMTTAFQVVSGITGLEVYNSTFTGASSFDILLQLAQSEITSCNNVWNTHLYGGAVLSKDSCEDAPASYKDYVYQANCTSSSPTPYGSTVCSVEVYIPDDCVNITTVAWTELTIQNETALNQNMSFTRYTCNPEGMRGEDDNCDNLYKRCTVPNELNRPFVRWDNYASGQNATSWHVITIPDGCVEYDGGAWFNMTGRLYMACKSFTQSGITIDGEVEACVHEMVCYNSDTMEERFEDCSSILTPCRYGCVEGVCLPVTTTTLPDGTASGSLVDLSAFGAGAWISLLFTPISLITMMIVGIGAYFEQQVKSNGAIFLAVIIVGSLGFTALGVYPAWVGVLIAVVCSAILSKAVLKLW